MKMFKHKQAMFAAMACIVIGAMAGIVGSAAAPSKSKSASKARPGRQAGPARHACTGRRCTRSRSCSNKAKDGFITVTDDDGIVESVSGDQLTIKEGTKTLTYKTVTLTIPSGAKVKRNFADCAAERPQARRPRARLPVVGRDHRVRRRRRPQAEVQARQGRPRPAPGRRPSSRDAVGAAAANPQTQRGRSRAPESDRAADSGAFGRLAGRAGTAGAWTNGLVGLPRRCRNSGLGSKARDAGTQTSLRAGRPLASSRSARCGACLALLLVGAASAQAVTQAKKTGSGSVT